MSDDPFRLLAANAIDYAMFTMDPDGLVQDWSPGAERLFGYSEAEMRGRRCNGLFVPEDQEAGVPELERALAVRAGRAENERWHLRKDGSRFWGAGEMMPLRLPDGRHVGFAKVLRDFTRRRELETAHLDAQRMESVGVLAGGLAHLFNNLLTATLGNLDLLLRLPAVQSNVTAQHLGQEAVRAGQRMVELTQQILTFAGKARSLLRPLDACHEISGVVEGLRREVPADVELDVHVSPPCPPVLGDQTLLRQLVTTLVLNAVEAVGASTGRKVVTVVAGTDDLSADAARRAYAGFDLLPGSYVRLEVTDTGPGLTPEAQARVFEPFFSTKFQGRGLGLAAALGIARMHGGAIAVRNSPEGGATFEVMLPVAESSAVRTGDGSHGEPGGAADQTALVIDDEELVRSLTGRILETDGFTVVQAENGQQAIRIAERVGYRITLVLLDLVMPVMDGVATLPKLRALLPGVPVILMTGLVAGDAASQMPEPGPDATIQKPFTVDQLSAAIEAAVSTAAGAPPAQ